MGKRKVVIRVRMTWDEGDDISHVILIVPEDVTDEMVREKIAEAHDYLCFEDEEDIYGSCGRDASTLADFICDKMNWEWGAFSPDVDITLD